VTESPSEILLLRNPPRGARRFVLLEHGADRMLDTLADDLVAFLEEEEKFEASLVHRLMHIGYPIAMLVMNGVLTKLDLFPTLRAGLLCGGVASALLQMYGLASVLRLRRRGELLFAQVRMFTSLVQVEAVKPTALPEETS